MQEKQFVVPYFDGLRVTIIKDEDTGDAILFGKKAVEEIIAPVRNAIIENDRRRDNAKPIHS